MDFAFFYPSHLSCSLTCVIGIWIMILEMKFKVTLSISNVSRRWVHLCQAMIIRNISSGQKSGIYYIAFPASSLPRNLSSYLVQSCCSSVHNNLISLAKQERGWCIWLALCRAPVTRSCGASFKVGLHQQKKGPSLEKKRGHLYAKDKLISEEQNTIFNNWYLPLHCN